MSEFLYGQFLSKFSSDYDMDRVTLFSDQGLMSPFRSRFVLVSILGVLYTYVIFLCSISIYEYNKHNTYFM